MHVSNEIGTVYHSPSVGPKAHFGIKLKTQGYIWPNSVTTNFYKVVNQLGH